jgi:hypothetical protein
MIVDGPHIVLRNAVKARAMAMIMRPVTGLISEVPDGHRGWRGSDDGHTVQYSIDG